MGVRKTTNRMAASAKQTYAKLSSELLLKTLNMILFTESQNQGALTPSTLKHLPTTKLKSNYPNTNPQDIHKLCSIHLAAKSFSNETLSNENLERFFFLP